MVRPETEESKVACGIANVATVWDGEDASMAEGLNRFRGITCSSWQTPRRQ